MQNKCRIKCLWTEQKDVCKHIGTVFHVDINDLVIFYSCTSFDELFLTSLQFNYFFKELVLYLLIHKVGNMRSIGMLGSKLLLNESLRYQYFLRKTWKSLPKFCLYLISV